MPQSKGTGTSFAPNAWQQLTTIDRRPVKRQPPTTLSDLGIDPGTPVDTAMRVPGEMLGVAGDVTKGIGSGALSALKGLGGGIQSLWKDPHMAPVPQTSTEGARTPYERFNNIGSSNPSATPEESDNTPPLAPPPRPAGLRMPQGVDTFNAGGGGQGQDVGIPINAPMDGLQSAVPDSLEVKAPYMRPGALTPQKAVDTFQASQPAEKPRFTPSNMELSQLMHRDPKSVSPGSNEMWGHQLEENLKNEEFNSPEAESARAMEMYKVGGPERVAGVQGKYDVEKQQAANKGALDVQGSRAALAEANAGNFRELVQMMGPGGLNRVSMPGLGSVSATPEKPIPTQLLQQVMGARQSYENAKKRLQPWQSADIPEKAVYNQAVSQAIAGSPAPPEIKQMVIQVLTDPNMMDKPIDDLFDFSDADQAHQDAVINLLLSVRGF